MKSEIEKIQKNLFNFDGMKGEILNKKNHPQNQRFLIEKSPVDDTITITQFIINDLTKNPFNTVKIVFSKLALQDILDYILSLNANN